ncbi:MAG: PI31 proteasome regulator N-terminal-domain-containing protein [Piptocephalis tieghemiana]|nr:MAG: PI31 proteasome regulator N-terminal-domain-containing protein [Piptocephalis tieghemiana]
MSDNPLAAPQILQALNKVLKASTEEGSSKPTPFHLLAATLHVAMLAVGFQLRSLGEEGGPADSTTTAILPRHWLEIKDHATFQYTHPQSSLTFLVKIIRLWENALIAVSVKETGKIFNVQVPLKDYINDADGVPTSQGDPDFAKVFVAYPKSLTDLLRLIKVDLIQNMLPELDKSSYEESFGHDTTTATSNPSPSPPGARPEVPGVRDHPSARNPLSVGESDVHPLGPYPLGGPMPGASGQGGGGEGMFVGPNHPMFGGGGIGSEGGPTNPFPSGSGSLRLPPGSVPPGARFDPIGPLDPLSGQRPGRGRGGGYGRGGGGHPFSGDPDNDEFPPPGNNDFYM